MPTVSRTLAIHPPPGQVDGLAKLLNPVMKVAFEKLASDTEKQMTTALNGLTAKEQK